MCFVCVDLDLLLRDLVWRVWLVWVYNVLLESSVCRGFGCCFWCVGCWFWVVVVSYRCGM